MSPAFPQPRDCPFCQRQDVSVSHVAHHLRRVACFSLPRLSGNEASVESAKGVSNGAQVDSDSTGGLYIGSIYDGQGNLDDMEHQSVWEEGMLGLDHTSTLKTASDHETLRHIRAASLRGNKKLVQLLLEKGADVNAYRGEHGNALQAASTNGHTEIVRLLRQVGADVNAQGGNRGNAL